MHHTSPGLIDRQISRFLVLGVHDAADVGGDGGLADEQARPDLLVAQAFGDITGSAVVTGLMLLSLLTSILGIF